MKEKDIAEGRRGNAVVLGSRKAGLVYYYYLPIYIFHVTWLDIIALHDFFFFFGVI